MREQLEKRLQALTTEYETGQKALANLESQKANLRETLLRISGAIQVLEEELTVDNSQNNHQVEQLSPTTIEVISET